VSRVLLISGGSRGLGLALVRAARADGDRVAVFSRSRSEAIAALEGDDAFLWRAVDAADEDALQAFVGTVLDRFGRIDVLINNAGLGTEGLLATMRIPDIDALLDVNLRAALLLARFCSRPMLRQGDGCILNISSVNAVRGHAGVAAYSATKAALEGMTRSLARELGPKQIRVNAIAPGYFESEMVVGLDEKAKARIQRRTPLGRLARIDEIVAAARFLTSPAASFITGQTLIVDGGITC